MQQLLFQREIVIDAPLPHVWQFFASEEGLRQWWGNPIFLEAKEGGRCEEWRPGRNGTSHWMGVVTQYAPPHHLTLTMRPQEARQDTPEITTIAISLEAQGEQTRVHVSHRAFGSTEAIGTDKDRVPVPQPAKPYNVPLAQLVRPAPGALPIDTAMPAPEQIDPAYHLLSQQRRDALNVTWQHRLNTLATLALELPDLR